MTPKEIYVKETNKNPYVFCPGVKTEKLTAEYIEWLENQVSRGSSVNPSPEKKFTGASPIKDVANAMAEMTDELRELLDEMKAAPKAKANEETEQQAIYVTTRYNYGSGETELIMVDELQAEAEKQAEEWFLCIGGAWTCLEYNHWECEEKQTVIKITKVILNR